jgi:hypothetical protein
MVGVLVIFTISGTGLALRLEALYRLFQENKIRTVLYKQ